MRRARIAVLASGGGSNLQAVLDYLAQLGESRSADVVLVATDRAQIGALDRAARQNIPAVITRSRLAPDAPPLAEILAHHAPDVVALAGYLQLIPASVTRQFHGRMLNVHPAPLPDFGGRGMYGARVHRAVIAAHATQSGPTVHFVDDQYDHGAEIAHWPVPVFPGDDDRALADRVLRAEHLLYPPIVHAVAAGEVVLGSDGRLTTPFLKSPLPMFDPAADDATLRGVLDNARR